MEQPLVSIIIPTFNRAILIGETLIYVLSQTYENWECIVVDDGSNDDTKEVVEQYSKKDNRIKYLINSQKKGAQGARNTGLITASGKFIIFFDSDNVMFKDYLERKVSYFEKNSEVDIVTSFSHVLDEDSIMIGTFCWITKGNIHKSILERSTYVDNNSAMIRKSFLDKSELLDENCPSYQEWDLHIHLSKNANYGYIPEFLTGYYRRGNGTISSDKLRELQGHCYVLLKHKFDFLSTLGLEWFRNEITRICFSNESLISFAKNTEFWDNELQKIYESYKKYLIVLKLKRTISRIIKKII